MHGVESDYASLHQPGKDDADRWQLHLTQLLINGLGEAAAAAIRVQRHTVDGRELYRVHVPPSPFPVYVGVPDPAAGKGGTRSAFYVRFGNATREIKDSAEQQKFTARRFATN